MKLKPFPSSLTAAIITCTWAVSANATPIISSVSAISPQQFQTITITGSGFGTHNPYIGDSNYINFGDLTKSWSAGYSGLPCPGFSFCNDLVTLSVVSWTDSTIVLGGFYGAWGSNNWTLSLGDSVEILVSNPQTGTSALSGASITTTVSAVPPVSTPEPGTSTLLLSGLSLLGLVARRRESTKAR